MAKALKKRGTQAEYAAYAGITQSAVSQLVKTGKIERDGSGLIDFASADKARKVGAESLVDLQKRLVDAKANHEELRVEERRGELLTKEDVAAAANNAAAIITKAIDGLRGWGEDLRAVASDRAAHQDMLTGKVTELRNTIADSLSKIGHEVSEKKEEAKPKRA